MSLDAGAMDREIVLQTATKTQDADTGEETIDWTLITETIWAQWLGRSTREVFTQQRVGSYIDGMFRIYDMSTRPAPDSTRVVFDGRLYDVTGVVEIGRGEGLELMVVAHGESL